jgi:CCR4-NOT transcription complex subunit 3
LQQEQLRQQQLKQQQEQLRQQEALRAQQQQQAAQEALQRQQQQQQQQEALRIQQAQQQQAAQEAAAQQAAAQLQAQQRAAAEQKAQTMQNQQLQQQQQQQGQIGPTNALDILTSGLGGLGLGGPMDANRGSDTSNLTQLGSSSQGVGVNSALPSNGNLDVAQSSYLSALNESFVAAPSSGDNERSRQYTPQNPYPAPASYPSAPSAIFDNPAVFEKLGTDCLFFIFYYAQGTYQQYLAARELKKQSWRFHKKYMTWFQRHEEPKITTDEYEQGTYVYFDYETGWCTRIKQDFRFEYSFLEDSLQ